MNEIWDKFENTFNCVKICKINRFDLSEIKLFETFIEILNRKNLKNKEKKLKNQYLI